MKLLILLFVLSVACMEQKPVEEIVLPPDYKILCNVDKYIIEMPGGIIVYRWNHSHMPYDTYQDAAAYAWELYDYQPLPPDTVEYYVFVNYILPK